LARWLGVRTGLAVHHMDKIHWLPGWVARPRGERREMALKVEARGSWIFEGGFSTTYDNRAARADTLIWLDLPVGVRLWRVTKRLILLYGQSRPDMPDGCAETLHRETLPFYVWIWQTRHSHRARLVRLLADHPHLAVYHLRSAAEVRAFQEEVS